MTSIYTCVGVLMTEPKRYYIKDGCEVSIFRISVKRSDKTNRWDVFRFEAFNNQAHFINNYLHYGDVASFVSRPFQKVYKNKKGERIQDVVFRVISLDFICSKERYITHKFGGKGMPDFQDIDYNLVI